MYSIDTSGLLDGMKRNYPPATFPGIWGRVDELVAENELKACEMVKAELAKKDDEALQWMNDRPDMVLPLDEARQIIVRDILHQYPRLVDTKKGRSGADPFVIAVAIHYECPVITGEPLSGNAKSPRIPDVCAALNIPYLTFLQLIQQQGWIFR